MPRLTPRSFAALCALVLPLACTAPALAASRTFEPDRWYLLTPPSDGNDAPAAAALRDLAAAPGARLFTYAGGDTYLTLDAGGDGAAFADGLALWFRHSGPAPITVTTPDGPGAVATECTPEQECAWRDVGPAGWHMLGTPYSAPVGVASRVEIRTASADQPCHVVACPLAEAALLGLVDAALWTWGADTGAYTNRIASTLEPWAGAWLRTRVDGLRWIVHSPWCFRAAK